jgi:hypothetical protein
MSRHSRHFLLLPLVFLMLGQMSWAAQVPPPGFAGTWDISMMTRIPGENTDCMFSGKAMVEQSNGDLSGTVMLKMSSGPDACPSEMSASMSGMAANGGVQFGVLMGGNLGEAMFEGKPGDLLNRLIGSFEVTTGPFADQDGTWSAMMAAPPVSYETKPVPSLAFYGAVFLLLMLLVIGSHKLRDRRLT